MEKKIKQLIDQGELAQVHILDEDQLFSLSLILASGDTWIKTAVFDREGIFDGLRLVRVGAIRRLAWDTAYVRARSERANESFKTVKNLFDEVGVDLPKLLTRLRETGAICDVALNEEVHMGSVTDFDREFVVLRQIDTEIMLYDGETLLPIEDIDYIAIQTQILSRMKEVVVSGKPVRGW